MKPVSYLARDAGLGFDPDDMKLQVKYTNPRVPHGARTQSLPHFEPGGRAGKYAFDPGGSAAQPVRSQKANGCRGSLSSSGSNQAREGRLVNALAARGDERRDTLR